MSADKAVEGDYLLSRCLVFRGLLGGFWFKRSHTRWDLERGHDVFLNIYLPTVSLLNKILTKMSPKYGDSI